jgi:hypothetical protein
MMVHIASFFNLVGPDMIVIALVIAVLFGISALIALSIVYIINRRSKKPPPLPTEAQSPQA